MFERDVGTPGARARANSAQEQSPPCARIPRAKRTGGRLKKPPTKSRIKSIEHQEATSIPTTGSRFRRTHFARHLSTYRTFARYAIIFAAHVAVIRALIYFLTG